MNASYKRLLIEWLLCCEKQPQTCTFKLAMPSFWGHLRRSVTDAWKVDPPPLTVCSETETAFVTNAATINS